MGNPPDEPRVRKLAAALVQEARALADDYGPAVRAEIDAAVAELLDDETATQLFTRILVVLRTGQLDLGATEAVRVAAEVRDQVVRVVGARRQKKISAGIQLVEHNGLRPHPVAPVPSFNGVHVPMEEGYVNVLDLQLWPDNSRIELYVQEFEEREHRAPDAEDVLNLVQGRISLQSVTERDPFHILPLARSIARKGVERPPIVTWEGQLKDGNRRVAAARLVLQSPDFTAEQKEVARWAKVWRAPAGTTDDQFDAIIVALNFEDEYKEPWPEYVKARKVAERYHSERDNVQGPVIPAVDKQLRQQVADLFAIKPPEVTRYLRMVQWAEDFEAFHTEVRALDPAAVRYKANDIFQWFYEIQAGRGGEKLTEVLERDEALKPIVYDLMYNVLDSGAQLRSLHKVVRDETALEILRQAHETWDSKQNEDGRKGALGLVDQAILESKQNTPTTIGFELFVNTAIQKFGTASPDQWASVKSEQLLQLARVLPGTLGAIKGQLATHGVDLQLDVE